MEILESEAVPCVRYGMWRCRHLIRLETFDQLPSQRGPIVHVRSFLAQDLALTSPARVFCDLCNTNSMKCSMSHLMKAIYRNILASCE